MEVDSAPQLAAARADDLIDVRKAEGDEEEARLVDVAVVPVDDVDRGLVLVEAPAEAVCGHRPASSAAEDHDLPSLGAHRVT